MSKPVAVKVFGILNIIFGTLGLIASPINLINVNRSLDLLDAEGFYRSWTYFSIAITPVTSIVLLVLGIGLLRYREWGRRGTVIYSWFIIVLAILSALITVASLATRLGAESDPIVIGGIVGGIIGGFVGLIYPIVSLVFLTRPSAKAACR